MVTRVRSPSAPQCDQWSEGSPAPVGSMMGRVGTEGGSGSGGGGVPGSRSNQGLPSAAMPSRMRSVWGNTAAARLMSKVRSGGGSWTGSWWGWGGGAGSAVEPGVALGGGAFEDAERVGEPGRVEVDVQGPFVWWFVHRVVCGDAGHRDLPGRSVGQGDVQRVAAHVLDLHLDGGKSVEAVVVPRTELPGPSFEVE